MMRGQDYDSESDSLKRDQTEEFCRQLVGTFPGALGVSLVRRGRIERRWVSRGLAEITGYGVEELESQPDLHLKSIHPEDRPTIERAMLELDSGQSVHADYRVMHKNGETRWIREICTAGDQAPDGALPVIVMAQDITEEKAPPDRVVEFGKVLRQSEKRYRTLVAGLDAVVMRVDPKLRPVSVVGRIEESSGYSADELVDNPKLLVSLVHSDDVRPVKSRLMEMASSRMSGSVDFRIVKPNGEIRWVRSQVAPQFDEGGDLTCFDVVAVDVSETVQASQREMRYAARMAALTDIGQAFASSLNVSEITELMVTKTAKALDSLCAALMVDQKTSKLAHMSVRHRSGSKVTNLSYPGHSEMMTVEQAFGSSGLSPRIWPDLQQAEHGISHLAKMLDWGPAITAPVYAGDKLLCIVGCPRMQGEPGFDEEDLWFLQQVASYAAGALVNASLYERQSDIAQILQRSLTPMRPEIKGLDISTWYNPAAGDAEVGGDFFDIIEFGDGVVAVVVGDVSGKGVEAAVNTAQAKYMLRGFAHQDRSPDSVVSLLNQGLHAFTDEYTFVTLVYALLDPAKGTMDYVNAGHEPQFIVRRQLHHISELSPRGLALGIRAEEEYQTQNVEVESGDALFFYTDGVLDVQGRNDRFGYERLVDALKKARFDSADELVGLVKTAVENYCRGPYPDDQVIVAVRPNG